MKRNIFVIMAAALLAAGCLDQEIQYYPSALQDLSDKPAAITLHAECSADNVVKVVLNYSEGSTVKKLFAASSSPSSTDRTLKLESKGTDYVAQYSKRTGIDYKLLEPAFYSFIGGNSMELHGGMQETVAKQLMLFAKNKFDTVLESGRYLLPVILSEDLSPIEGSVVNIDLTIRNKYSDPDGYELYQGNDMFTVFYLNTAVFDPRLANDFILEDISDPTYHRGLGNIVNLRQASLYYDNKLGKVSMKLNNDLRYVLEHFTERVLPVQESGRKVCVCIDGGAQGIGFCNLTDEQIEDFAKSVKKIVEHYGLDGINLWDRNANYAVAEEKGFPKVNTTSYPKLIKALREALGQNKLLTVTDYDVPTEYFWDTEATGGIKVGEYIDYAWSGYCGGDEPVQIVDPWHQELSFVSKLHPRKPFAGLNPRRYGITNVTCYRKADDSLFALEQYDKSLLTDSNMFVFYDVRSNIQDSYEGANIMDQFMASWCRNFSLSINPGRLDNDSQTFGNKYNKWIKDW